MYNGPKVTIIVPTYNRPNLLPRAIKSILNQTFTDYEIIIVDDASTDHTPEVLSEFNDPRIRSFRHKINKGQSAARNLGIYHARGEYIAFLDDDDECVPTRLEDQVALLDASPAEVGIVYGWMSKHDDSTGEIENERGSVLNGDVFELALTGKNIMVTITMLVRSHVAREIGGFDERLSMGEDPHFVCNIVSKYQIACLPKTVCIRHVNHGYPRISEPSEAQRIGMDKYLRVHIQRFSNELSRRPKLFSEVLRWSAVCSMECRDIKRSLSVSNNAFWLHPFNIGNIRHILRLIKVFIFYASPMARYRRHFQNMQSVLGLRHERKTARMISHDKDV